MIHTKAVSRFQPKATNLPRMLVIYFLPHLVLGNPELGVSILEGDSFYFFIWGATPLDLQDLSSPTRDRTRAPCSGGVELEGDSFIDDLLGLSAVGRSQR